MPVFQLAVATPQCHLAQGIILPPVSFPTLCDRALAQPEQLPSMAPSAQSLLGVSLLEQALRERCDPTTQHRAFGAELEGEHSYFKSKCSITA